MEITTVGLDLAKNVFQVHAIGSTGGVVVRRSLRRAQVIPFFSKLPPCLIGMEACGTSHHWARELVGLGHEVRLMPPAYVKPYVKRGKTDAGDAEAICEAVTRPTMRFVPIKSVEQQAALALHRTRDLLVRQRTQLVNMIRGLLAEFGIAIPKGITNALAFVRRAVAGEANEVPDLATKVIAALAEQAIEVQCRIRQLERDLLASFRSNDLARRIATVPGVGLLGATAIAATVTDPTQFRSGRQGIDARIGRIEVMLVAPDERGHAGDQKTPQVLIAHLRDVTEPLLATAGVVERREAEPSRELTSRAEVGRVSDGGG